MFPRHANVLAGPQDGDPPPAVRRLRLVQQDEEVDEEPAVETDRADCERFVLERDRRPGRGQDRELRISDPILRSASAHETRPLEFARHLLRQHPDLVA